MRLRPLSWISAACLQLIGYSSASCGAASANEARLQPANVAIIVNTADPLSIAIGDYYAARRHIARTNFVRVRFDADRDDIPVATFASLKRSIDRQLGGTVQATALTWARPYRVGCMSITSALAFGIHAEYCSVGCKNTQNNPYFDQWHGLPYADLGIRPAMMLAARDLPHARELIDRGVAADATHPSGTGYLIVTSDRLRNARALEYSLAERVAGHEFDFKVTTGSPADAPPQDVMFYFTGAAAVATPERFRFKPGAIADHLTSFGGMLTDSAQMSSLRWLEAGATGSYGAVVEPCNLLGKFPNVAVLMGHYLAGDTLIEAYWKSVQMPGQGLFIGEPLAAPFSSPPSNH